MRIEESLVLPVTPEALWPWISTPARLAEWIGDVERFEARPAGELTVGSSLVAHLPRGTPIEATVESAEPSRTLVLLARGVPHDLEVRIEFRVEALEGGSRLTLGAQTRLSGLMVFAEKMIAGHARAKLASWTTALRARVVAG